MAATALILDLDGTVWDSAPWYEALASTGGANRTLSGTPAATLLKAAGYTPARFARACANDPIVIYPGLGQSLDKVAGAGVTLGVVTNLPNWMVDPMMSNAGIAGLFTTVVDYAATRRHKPHPEPLLKACAELGLRPRDCWYVGDDPNDAAAARAAGMSFAWAAWGYTAAAPAGADCVLAEPGDLASLLDVTL